MRNKDRIPFVLDKLEIKGEMRKEITKLWESNLDMRLFQLLVNFSTQETLDYVASKYSKIIGGEPNWHTECIGDILKGGEMLWTSYVDKDKKFLDKPITRQLKDLSDWHLKNIRRDCAISESYKDYIKERVGES